MKRQQRGVSFWEFSALGTSSSKPETVAVSVTEQLCSLLAAKMRRDRKGERQGKGSWVSERSLELSSTDGSDEYHVGPHETIPAPCGSLMPD